MGYLVLSFNKSIKITFKNNYSSSVSLNYMHILILAPSMIKSRDQIQFAFIIYVFLASEVRWASDLYLWKDSGCISLDHSCLI